MDISKEQKDLKTKIRKAQKAVELEPENAKLWYDLGVRNHKAKQYEKAIEAKEKAVELEPENALYWNSLGISYNEAKQYEKAIESKVKAVELEPENAKYRNSLGVSYQWAKQYEKAVEETEKAVELEPENALYCKNLGASYLWTKQYEKAIESTEKAVKYEPENALYWHNLGVSYRKIEEYNKAKELAEKAVEKIKDKKEARLAYAFYHCGWMNYLITGDIEKAKEYFLEGRKCLLIEENTERVVNYITTLIREIKENNHFALIQCFAHIHSDFLKGTQYHFINKIISDFETTPEIQAKLIGVQVSAKRIMDYCAYKREKEGLQENEFYHYSKINSLCKIVRPKNKDDRASSEDNNQGNNDKYGVRLRLNNASYMNDPSEGRMLIDYLRECYADRNTLLDEFCKSYYHDEYTDMQASNVYLFSLTFAKDELPMWIQYGSHGNGFCFGMKSSFFDMEYDEMQHDIMSESDEKIEASKKYIPYRVVYIDNQCENGLEIHFGGMNSEEDKKQAELIKTEIENISSYFEDISNLCKNNNEVKEKAFKHLKECIEQIRFLFKSSKYEYEKELRLIRYAQVDSKEVRLYNDASPVPQLYVEKDDGKPLDITRIILGPKVPEPSEIVPYIKHVDKEILVVRSKVEFR